jgi:aminopeptidase N
MKSSFLLFVLIVLWVCTVTAQRELGARPTVTGGAVPYEQAAYDVLRYDIGVKIDPENRSISGWTMVTARIVQPINVFVLDLDDSFTVSEVARVDGPKRTKLRFERRGGKIWSFFPMTEQSGKTVRIEVVYAGTPRVAPRPPWVGGFMWEKTADGRHWISTAYQNDGADLMFPCKDYPHDKPDSVSIAVTVPEGLYAASIGKLVRTVKNPDKTSTYNWLMTNPIANYSVTVNIAPYKVINDTYRSVSGETFPLVFYALPENAAKVPKLLEETKKYLAFFEKYLGPYPFRSQKLGIAETPHLGMEHSTIIAYGNKYQFDKDGFDWLMFHELGHEWWANLVTASDWRDFWIHEGFQSFMDTLYLGSVKGQAAYIDAMKRRARATRNMQPVAPREAKIAYEVYLQAPDFIRGDGDIYGKGAVVLHTLRYLVGDDAFFRALRRMAYPAKASERVTTGAQTRFANTDDFLTIAEDVSGMELDWFFEVYLRQPELPRLTMITTGDRTDLKWLVPNGLPFPMPVEISVGGKVEKLQMKDGTAVVYTKGVTPVIDPNGLVLMKSDN